MRYFSLLIFLLVLNACKYAESDKRDRILVTITRDYLPRPESENAVIVLDWSEIKKLLPVLKDRGIIITDQHFGKMLDAHLIDTDKDGKADKVLVDYPFTSKEPVYTMMIKADSKPVPKPVTSDAPEGSRFILTYLNSYDVFSKNDTITNWPQRIFESTLHAYPDPAMLSIFSPGEWTYEYGFFLNAGFELWQRNGKDDYYNYIKAWADRFLSEDGSIKESEYDVTKYRLDDILPGRLFIFLYQETGDEKYKKAAGQLRDHLAKQPRTKEGGYWHKQIYPHQMWLDGIYMADIFSMQYAAAFNEPQLFDEAAHQIKLIAGHTTDPATGLMYHGWDESKNPVWADSVKGTSSEFWARGMGWYLMALTECLEYLPKDHADRKEIISIFQNLSRSIAAYQDDETALWYQVVNKADHAGNWVETSASAMYAYAFAKGYNKGYLDKSYYERARKAFHSIIKNHCYFNDAGDLYLDQTVKVGTLNMEVSKGDYAYYISGERRINDFKGLSPLLYTSLELSETRPTVSNSRADGSH